MSEEIIKITIDYVLDEVKGFNITNLDGLCFYFSQNIFSYLSEQGIDVSMYNIRDLANANFDHYFLIADGFLIDLTYSQFLPRDGELRFFKDWPSNILNSSDEGRNILNNLLNNGYFKLDNNLDIYLNSFKAKEKSL